MSTLSTLSGLLKSIVLSVLLLSFAPGLTGSALAGGFQLGVQTPQPGNAELKDAVLVVRTYGCHTPADAVIGGVAEGIVKGERRSVKLTFRPVSTGVYALTQEWPSEGSWVLSLTGDYNGMTCSVLVQLGENGRVIAGTRLEAGSSKGTNARSVARKWTNSEINEALAGRNGIAEDTSGSGISWPIAGIATGLLSLTGLFFFARRSTAV